MCQNTFTLTERFMWTVTTVGAAAMVGARQGGVGWGQHRGFQQQRNKGGRRQEGDEPELSIKKSGGEGGERSPKLFIWLQSVLLENQIKWDGHKG